MNKGLEEYKVNFNGVLPSIKRVTILQKYIEKNKEINRVFDEEDGIDTNNLNYEPDASAIINKIEAFSRIREISNELDCDRRFTHNAALVALRGLVDFGKKNNLEPLYEGRLLTEEQIEAHDARTYDIRREMTDGFLQILKDIDFCKIQQVSSESSKEMNILRDTLDKVNRDYGVIKSLKHDDGDIEFKDFKDQIRGFGL